MRDWHSGGGGQFDQYLMERAFPVGEYLGRVKDLFLYSFDLKLRYDIGDLRSEILDLKLL